jgi:transcriptional regulator with XRE-family HTH domain
MSTSRGESFEPQWTLGDRLRKARSLTGLTTREFADRLGVSHGTVSAAENDHVQVRRIVINAWSAATGVSVEWLRTGHSTPHIPPDDGARGAHNDQLARFTDRKRRRAAPPAETSAYQCAA